MSNSVYRALDTALRSKQPATIDIKSLETIWGDDWLLEISQQAMKLGACLEPHPIKPELLLVRPKAETLPRETARLPNEV